MKNFSIKWVARIKGRAYSLHIYIYSIIAGYHMISEGPNLQDLYIKAEGHLTLPPIIMEVEYR